MNFKFFSGIFLGLILSIKTYALVGADDLFRTVEASHQEILALQKNSESAKASGQAAFSGFLPTLSVVGGWQSNRVDNPFETERGYNGYIEGRLNIFRGFKDASFKSRLQLAGELALIDLELKKREIRFELTEVLTDLIILHQLQEIILEELSINKTQKQMAQRKVSAGMTSKVDNLEFELRESEIMLEQKHVDQQHEESHQKYFSLTGVALQDSDVKKVNFSSESAFSNLNKKVNLSQTLQYQKASLLQAQAEYSKNELKSDFLPTLDFTYAVGRITPTEEDQLKLNESKYGVQLTIPLFSGLDTYYRTRSASFLSQSLENSKNQARNTSQADYEIQISRLNELNFAFQINEKKISNSEKYYNLTLAEYKRGIKNSPDLVSATDRYFSAKKKKLEIQKNLELVKVKIENYN